MDTLKIGAPETPAELDEYFKLRWRILRAPWGQPRGSEQDEFERVANHVTVRDKAGELLGIGRLHLTGPGTAQIRYMATTEASRGRGIGKIIIDRLETLAHDHGAQSIVLDARNSVTGFYEHLGYKIVGPGPTLFGEVPHTHMKKQLSAAHRNGYE